MPRETIHIGGGDDWMPVDLVDAAHQPNPKSQVGMFPDCLTCGGRLIRLSVTEIRHVEAHKEATDAMA